MTYLEGKKRARGEPQGMVLSFDVLSPILLCLNQFMVVMFETSIVQSITSGQINFVGMYR